MVYVQFYIRSHSGPVAACGDRSVVILDGRCSREWMEDTAAQECQRRGYYGWQIFRGESFTRSKPTASLVTLNPLAFSKE